MSYKINVASYLTKATVGSGLKIFIFFFFGGEEGRVTQAPPLCFPLVMRGRRTRILNPSSSLRASLKHLPSPTMACLFRIILVSESSTRSQNKSFFRTVIFSKSKIVIFA